MDGGSQDETIEILRKHSGVISYWQSKPDDGQYAAIQEGFSKSTGDILCWLNADDMLLPRSLWVVAEIFQQFNEVEWLSTIKPGEWDAKGYLMGHANVPGFSRDAFLDGLNLPIGRKGSFCIQQESTFWRRSLWEKVGSQMPLQYPLAGDFALWAEFYKHARLYGVDYPIAGFRRLEGQRSQDIKIYTDEAKIALESMRRHFFWKKSVRSMIIYTGLFKFIKRRSAFKRRFGYQAIKITKKQPSNPNSIWGVVEYRFTP